MIGGLVPRPVDKLMALQQLDKQIMRHEKECEDIPARKKQIADSTANLKEALAQAKQNLLDSQAKVHEREISADSERETIKKLRSQQLLLKTNKEFKAMDEEIQTVERRISAIEDAQIELLEGVDQAQVGVQQAEQALAQAEDQAKLQISKMDERSRELQEQLASLAVDRDAEKEGVRPDWLKEYERRLQNRTRVAIAPVEHGVCTGCNMKLSPQIVHTARFGDSLISCSFCGIFLC